MEVQEIVKEIKLSMRQMMDGAVAKSMRDKGVAYKLNWGATLPRLSEKADELRARQDMTAEDLSHLAIALWKEDVRECKILATMVMPPERMLPEVLDIWMEQIPSQEIAEQLAFNLVQHLPYAAEKAYQWIAGSRPYEQLCGYHVMSRLFMNGREPNERGIHEYIDQVLVALQEADMPVRKAAMQSLRRFAALGLVYERIAKSAIKSISLDFL